jgi:tRNA pseudouridine55 synthase
MTSPHPKTPLPFGPTGKRARCRAIDGVLLLDKPAGYTSNQALQAAKRALQACKAGHTGSLDPIATGLLPLCFGEATKISQYLLDADKHYQTVFRLGQSTTTYDCEGDVTDIHPVTLGRRDIERVLSRFEGELSQTPPMYSAIKHGGQALYKLARAGISVERQPRQIHIHELTLLQLEGTDLTLEIRCSKGTYIRSLAHDIGQALGCGAHVAQLRRLAVGQFRIDQTITLEALQALAETGRAPDALLSVDAGLGDWPSVQLTSLATHYLRQGQTVSARHDHAPGRVRLYDEAGRFLGMGEVCDDGRVAPRRLIGSGIAP